MADSTINGLTALVGSDVDQTADQFAVWDNSAATTKKITRTNVMTGPLVGDVGSAVRAAADSYGGVAFNGATAGSRVTSTMTAQAFSGTGDFSVWLRFRVPTANPSGTSGVVSLSDNPTSPFTANAFFLDMGTNGSMSLFKRSGANASQTAFQVLSVVSTYAGQVIDVVVTRVDQAWKIYINGADVTPASTSYANETVSFTYLHLGAGGSAPCFNDRIYRVAVFNRGLSASDAAELSVSGVNPADQWGTQAAVYTKATFASGQADNWAPVDVPNVTSTTGATAPDATTDWMKVERTGAGTARCDIKRTSTVAVGGKRYRMSATIYNEDCGTQWFGLQADNLVSVAASSQQLANGAQGIITQEFVSGTSTEARIGPIPNSTALTSSGAVASGANWYFKNVTVTRIGALVDLDLGCGIGYQAHDRSTNLLHGTLFGGVSWASPKKSGTVYGTTDTNGNQLLLGTTSIPSDAAITSVVVNSLGATPDITIGNVSGGTQLIGLTGLSGVSREIVTPTLPISTTGNLWISSNSADTLNWTINYTTSF